MLDNNSIFIIEGDPKFRQLLSDYFTFQKFDVTSYQISEIAIEDIIEKQPGTLLLDLMPPRYYGLAVCRQIRCNYLGNILILSAKNDDYDHVVALELGADDFIVKSIQPRVLLARIRTLLRRLKQVPQLGHSNILNYGQLHLNGTRKVCQFHKQPIPLTISEFELLWKLASNPYEVLSRSQLLSCLRGREYDGLDRSVDCKIMVLRKKLGDLSATPKHIVTVRNKGYKFIPDLL
ncbi:response regulator transcription factor [Vibrio sp. S4M6]|uniref:response regulator transcription factor n=1 Tax=Vibrio sinus TaxID=2946865 RepID=UPI00202A7FDB|nr:response regulator transcription factor [Vibrio sinus]MCL9780717.1 response regulator transcription factor [Vibrio sinus]